MKEKYQNGCHLKTTSENPLIFDVHKIKWWDMCKCIPNMKFLHLNLWQAEVCTGDANANDDDYANNDDDANNDDEQSRIVKGSLVDKPNEQKKAKVKWVKHQRCQLEGISWS